MGHTRWVIGNVLRASVGTLAAAGFAAAAAAQAPAPAPAQQTAPATAVGQSAPAAPPPATPDAYSYNPEGRRDPFVSLLTRGAEMASVTNREVQPEGREGLAIGEVSVRGIVRMRNAFVAMVQGPDNKSYIVHTGDKMLDGVVKAITGDSVVFAQDVNDPLSLVKQREVRKTLRAPEEGK